MTPWWFGDFVRWHEMQTVRLNHNNKLQIVRLRTSIYYNTGSWFDPSTFWFVTPVAKRRCTNVGSFSNNMTRLLVLVVAAWSNTFYYNSLNARFPHYGSLTIIRSNNVKVHKWQVKNSNLFISNYNVYLILGDGARKRYKTI